LEEVTGESQLHADDALRSLLSFRIPGRFRVCSKIVQRRNRFKTEAPVLLLSIEDARIRPTLSLFGRALAVAVEVLAAGQWRTVLIASEAKASHRKLRREMSVTRCRWGSRGTPSLDPQPWTSCRGASRRQSSAVHAWRVLSLVTFQVLAANDTVPGIRSVCR
jgi:hypothetical protein